MPKSKSECDKAYYLANLEKKKTYYKTNREKILARVKKYQKSVREKINIYKRVLYKTNKASREKALSRKKDDRNKNQEKYRERYKAIRVNLTRSYVASTLKIPVSQCPESLIEAKRAILRIQRHIKEMT